MENKLINHLPPKLAEIKEIADIQYAIEPELDDILRIILRFLNNRLPQLADRDGITEWELWLGIIPDDTLSLEERRTNLLLKLNSRIPYTEVQLHRILASAVGWDGYEFTIDNFELLVEIAFDRYDKLPAVRQILDQIVPAHIWREAKAYIEAQFDIGMGMAYQAGYMVDIYPDHNRDPIESQMGVAFGGAYKIYRKIQIGI